MESRELAGLEKSALPCAFSVTDLVTARFRNTHRPESVIRCQVPRTLKRLTTCLLEFCVCTRMWILMKVIDEHDVACSVANL
jgi:hypothetical protein